MAISGFEALGKGATSSVLGRREHWAPKPRVTIAFGGGRVYGPGQSTVQNGIIGKNESVGFGLLIAPSKLSLGPIGHFGEEVWR